METPEDVQYKLLSPRQRQVCELLLEAKAVKEIAQMLRMSPNSVKDHVKQIYLKMSVHSARELMARRLGTGGGEEQVRMQESLWRLLHAANATAAHALGKAALKEWTQAAEAADWQAIPDGRWARGAEEGVHRLLAQARERFAVLVADGVMARALPQMAGRPRAVECLVVHLACDAADEFVLLTDSRNGGFGPEAERIAQILARVARPASHRDVAESGAGVLGHPHAGLAAL